MVAILTNKIRLNYLYEYNQQSSCPYTDNIFMEELYYSPKKVGDVFWNFEKFLIGRDGKPYTRYHPTLVSAVPLRPDIDYLLNQSFN